MNKYILVPLSSIDEYRLALIVTNIKPSFSKLNDPVDLCLESCYPITALHRI